MARKAKVRGRYIEQVRKNELVRRYDDRCGICGEDLRGDITIDHIVPVSKGGTHCYKNCQPAHRACNKAKADLMPHEVDSILALIGVRKKERYKNHALAGRKRKLRVSS